MTIQNIEDVMDRIMSLNKNMTEDSLQTLLSASGWDKEDILEGLHIFKSNKGNVSPVSPIENHIQNKISTPSPAFTPAPTAVVSPVPEPVKISTPTPAPKINTSENTYSLNIKPGFNVSAEDNNKNVKTEIQESINHVISDLPVAPTPGIIPPTSPTVNNHIAPSPSYVNENKKGGSGKIIFFILLILVLTFGLFYFYSSNFGANKNNTSQTNNLQNSISDQTVQNPVISPDQNTSSSSVVDNSNTDLSSSQIADLTKEVNALKAQIASYQKNTKSGQTIIKYISQRGPVGQAGRGVVSIDATSTGFLINYTDHTTAVIPYSTTTILNILNSGTVCFRDMNSSSTSQPQNDVCLDRNSVINILNK